MNEGIKKQEMMSVPSLFLASMTRWVEKVSFTEVGKELEQIRRRNQNLILIHYG